MRALCMGLGVMVASVVLTQNQAVASHLKIDKALLSEVNTLKKVATVQFDLAWDNSWKNEVNCDGIWVFAKYRVGPGAWKHVDLQAASKGEFDGADQAPEGFSKGSGEDVGLWVPEERKGAFVFKTKGVGTTATKGVALLWDYAKAGISDEDILKTKVTVLGLEMVNVPKDKHYVGDPKGAAGPDNTFYAYPDKGSYLIASEDPIVVDKVDGALYCDQDNPRSRDDVPFTIPKEFPKGFNAFWMMKYEMTSQQFVDFLNLLTRKQQAQHVESDISRDSVSNYYVKTATTVEKMRNPVVCPKKGNGETEPIRFCTTAPARGLNFVSWSDITAYADWAGLRPITELEYEKACRGPKDPVVDEYAWGTLDLGRVDTFDGADGCGIEKKVPFKGVVNACYGAGIAPFDAAAGKTVPDNPGYEGPVSPEIFENTAHEGVSERINVGAGYYGVRGLSGNLWERCITIGHAMGRTFDARRGDGELTEQGDMNVPNWPGKDGAGAGNRGGVWSSPGGKYLRFALRFAANFPKSEDGKHSGCRLGF